MRLKLIENNGLLRHLTLEEPDRYLPFNLSRKIEYQIIGDIMDSYANILVRATRPYIDLPYTEELSTWLMDLDTFDPSIEITSDTVRLAKPDDEMNRGKNLIFLSSSKVKALPTFLLRSQYILDCCYYSLKSYLERFKIDTQSLEDAYNRIRGGDFYFGCALYENKKAKTNPKLNLYAIVQRRRDLEFDDYRLAIYDLTTSEIVFTQALPQRLPLAVMRLQQKEINPEESPSNCYCVDGWKRNKYYFQWEIYMDELVEKYEFDWKTKILKRVDENN